MVSLVSKIADLSHIMNAQLHLRGKTRVPFSVRLQGRVQLSGDGEVVFGEGVSLVGTVVPVELVTYASGRIEIGNHTFINYGVSIAARASVKIGRYCHLGHYTFVMDNDQHDIIRHTKLPQSGPVIMKTMCGSGQPGKQSTEETNSAHDPILGHDLKQKHGPKKRGRSRSPTHFLIACTVLVTSGSVDPDWNLKSRKPALTIIAHTSLEFDR